MSAQDSEAPPAGVRTMAIVRWVLVALMALVAVGSVLWYFNRLPSAGGAAASPAGSRLYYCPMHPQIVQDHPGECPICSMTLVPKPEGAAKPAAPPASGPAAATGKYYCPMHPQVTSDDPNATCALCGGMKLVPRPAAASGGSGSGTSATAGDAVTGLVPVDIPLDRVQKIGVRTAPVTRESLVSDIRTVGVVEANERGLALVSTRFSGWIESLLVAETGVKVKRGQVLATVYSPDLLQAQQELLTALRWSAGSAPASGALPHHGELGSAEGLVADARHRLELMGIAPSEIDGIVRSRQVQRALAVRSPVEGYVITKNAVAGMTVSPGTPLFAVADLSSVWVVAELYESDLQRVRIGQKARFEASAFPGETFTGKVQFIYPMLDPSSRTLRARLELRNRPGAGGLKLRPGLYGSVSLDLPAKTGLMVPAQAVTDTGEVQYVFVAREGGRFEPRRVRLGARMDDKLEILEGVKEGEVVVTTASFLIDSESRLRAAIDGQSAGAAASGSAPAAPAEGEGPSCEKDFDKAKYPEKHRACRACEVQHRGMGTMEEDCKKAIAKPWR